MVYEPYLGFVYAWRVAAAACTFAAVCALVLWFGRWLGQAASEGRLLLAEEGLGKEVTIKESPLIARAAKLGIVFLPAARRWEASGRFGVAEMLANWERLLISAGLRPRLSPRRFLSAAIFSSVFVGGGGALFALAMNYGAAPALLLALPAGLAAGYYLPQVLLKGLAASRVSMIEKRLPYAAEFTLLVMEANAAFQSAIEVYVGQMAGDPLAEEFGFVLRDVAGGEGLMAAMRKMPERVHSESLSAFVLAVVTGMETGQPIKEVLKIQADVTRLRRYQSAEEIAKTASTRAVFPLFVVVLALLLLLLGPMVYKMASGSSFL